MLSTAGVVPLAGWLVSVMPSAPRLFRPLSPATCAVIPWFRSDMMVREGLVSGQHGGRGIGAVGIELRLLGVERLDGVVGVDEADDGILLMVVVSGLMLTFSLVPESGASPAAG